MEHEMHMEKMSKMIEMMKEMSAMMQEMIDEVEGKEPKIEEKKYLSLPREKRDEYDRKEVMSRKQ